MILGGIKSSPSHASLSISLSSSQSRSSHPPSSGAPLEVCRSPPVASHNTAERHSLMMDTEKAEGIKRQVRNEKRKEWMEKEKV